jgi:hypothetical protein
MPAQRPPTSDNRYRVYLFDRILGFFPRLALWLLVSFAFPLSVTAAALSFQVEVLGRTTQSALPQERSLTLAERVLVRLQQSEVKEIDPWMRDDIRIAWIATLEASRGNQQPNIDATYRVLGLHPDKVWPAICARRAALLGSLEAECLRSTTAKAPARLDTPFLLTDPRRKSTTISADSITSARNGKKFPPSRATDIPHNKKRPMAESRDGDAPQKTCAYGALPDQQTGTSCSTVTKREARRALTSEFGSDATPAGVAAPAGKKPCASVRTPQRKAA